MAEVTLEQAAHAVADAAREAVLPYFRAEDLHADNKADLGFDPVTEGDRAAERAMRAVLRDLRPDDSILGEEFGHVQGPGDITWVLDPIDGTRSYLIGAPVWGVLVAATTDQGPVFGIIDQPYTQERYEGGWGRAFLTDRFGRRALRTRPTSDLREARLCSTYPEMETVSEQVSFDRLRGTVRLTRFGTDCYGYALLAAGHVDLVVETGLQSYDVCAPIAVIEAAGGVVTDWDGRPAHGGGRMLAAANPALHKAALECLSTGL